jgi:protein-S-isoprenylcysteine O-methyltransferase Ste14
VLFLQLPIPIYWFVMHPQVNYWRQHPKAGYITGALVAWVPVTTCLIIFHRELFLREWPGRANAVTGITLIIFEGWIFWRVMRYLGGARFAGKTELSGGGELAHGGIYAYLRHPRYTGSFLAIVGACFLAGTRAMWAVACVWCLLTLIAILMEERELRARFGASYEEYCRRVPRFLPRGTKARGI